MFNLFNNSKTKNPIAEIYNGLTLNQKMSVLNLLLTIGVCDNEIGDIDKEMKYLNTYLNILGVRSDRCTAYLNSEGYQRIVSDLSTISQSQKEFLVVAAWEMIICDGKPNEKELQVTSGLFSKIGISEKEFSDIITKSYELMKQYSRH